VYDATLHENSASRWHDLPVEGGIESTMTRLRSSVTTFENINVDVHKSRRAETLDWMHVLQPRRFANHYISRCLLRLVKGGNSAVLHQMWNPTVLEHRSKTSLAR
jgi:hypothetical protein